MESDESAIEGGASVGDPWDILEVSILGNAISGILRQSQCVFNVSFLKV